VVKQVQCLAIIDTASAGDKPTKADANATGRPERGMGSLANAPESLLKQRTLPKTAVETGDRSEDGDFTL